MAPTKATESDGREQQIEDLHDSSTANSLPAKVLMTVTGIDLRDHHVVVPLPDSYEDALVLATESLGKHFGTNVPSQDFSLQYAMKSAAGNIVWADIIPRLWKEVVANGDELRLAKNGFDPQPANDSEFVTIGFLPVNGKQQSAIFCGVALMPRSYKAAKICALPLIKHLMQKKNPSVDDIIVKATVKVYGVWGVSGLDHISDADWMECMAVIKKGQSRIWFRAIETEAGKF